MPISGLVLDVIRVSVTTEIPFLRLGLISVIGIVTDVPNDRVTCARLGKRAFVIVRQGGPLMQHVAFAVVLILMLELLTTLEPRRLALLHVTGTIVLRIRGGNAVVCQSSAILMLLRMPRRWLIPTATFLCVIPENAKKCL